MVQIQKLIFLQFFCTQLCNITAAVCQVNKSIVKLEKLRPEVAKIVCVDKTQESFAKTNFVSLVHDIVYPYLNLATIFVITIQCLRAKKLTLPIDGVKMSIQNSKLEYMLAKVLSMSTFSSLFFLDMLYTKDRSSYLFSCLQSKVKNLKIKQKLDNANNLSAKEESKFQGFQSQLT